MIRDLVRTACVIATLAVAASLLVETRLRLTAIELASRQSLQPPAVYVHAPHPSEEPGRLARLGRATLGWADAALGVVR